ncbi:hypothetical protein [Siminovitchia fortis]|nr:hypothetical protein [Siminovitchia fortis]
MLSGGNVNEVFNERDVWIEGNFRSEEGEKVGKVVNGGGVGVKVREVY